MQYRPLGNMTQMLEILEFADVLMMNFGVCVCMHLVMYVRSRRSTEYSNSADACCMLPYLTICQNYIACVHVPMA